MSRVIIRVVLDGAGFDPDEPSCIARHMTSGEVLCEQIRRQLALDLPIEKVDVVR